MYKKIFTPRGQDKDFYNAMEFYLAEKEKAVPAPTGTDQKENYPVRV